MSKRRPPRQSMGRPPGSTSFDGASAIAFGDTVRELRSSSELAQTDLALFADLDRSFLSKIERGLAQPTLFAVLKISHALGFNAALLVAEVERKIEVGGQAEDIAP